jgi:Peptidase S24-like
VISEKLEVISEKRKVLKPTTYHLSLITYHLSLSTYHLPLIIIKNITTKKVKIVVLKIKMFYLYAVNKSINIKLKLLHTMIKDDRIQLNDRFIRVFHDLEERGIIEKNDRSGKGIGDFAESILGNRAYGHIIRKFLDPNDKRVIDYNHARNLCREYSVSEMYMIDGIGEPFYNPLVQNPKVKDMPVVQNFGGRRGNILYTTVQAFAGASVDIGTYAPEDAQYFAMPDLKGDNYVAFDINGSSMEPVIINGDIVIAQPLHSVNEIRDNDIYAVKNNGSVWIKYVQRIYSRGRITHLKLVSANYLEHDPFIEEVNENTRLYKVIRRISKF